MPPLKAGAGAQMFDKSVSDFAYPDGPEWIGHI
jgi:hypothetical protein